MQFNFLTIYGKNKHTDSSQSKAQAIIEEKQLLLKFLLLLGAFYKRKKMGCGFERTYYFLLSVRNSSNPTIATATTIAMAA